MTVEEILAAAYDGPPTRRNDQMLRWFRYSHLPERLQLVSAPFGTLAVTLVEMLDPSAERTVALRKLLESKDAAVRAAL